MLLTDNITSPFLCPTGSGKMNRRGSPKEGGAGLIIPILRCFGVEGFSTTTEFSQFSSVSRAARGCDSNIRNSCKSSYHKSIVMRALQYTVYKPACEVLGAYIKV
jgi:hypothetical protein